MREVYYCKSAYVLYNKTLFAIKVSNGDAGNKELRERLQDLCQSDIITEPIYSAPGFPPTPHPPHLPFFANFLLLWFPETYVGTIDVQLT